MPQPLTTIARSFNYKLNVGNYETRDFFCSQSLEVPVSEAEDASKTLFAFCKRQVMNAVREYKLEQKQRRLRRKE